MRPTSFFTQLTLRNAVTATLTVLVGLFVVVALGVVVRSIVENIRYVHATQQIHDLVTASRSYAERDPSFGTQSDQNALALLIRAQLIQGGSMINDPPSMSNPWNQPVRLTSVGSSIVRLETKVPSHDCRRLAAFLGKEASTEGLVAMDARQTDKGVWRRFYEKTRSRFDPKAADAACGREQDATLMLFFKVRE